MNRIYSHTVLAPKTVFFESEYRECPVCHKQVQRHIVCEGARWHILSWDSSGCHCSESDCERNHGVGKCIDKVR